MITYIDESNDNKNFIVAGLLINDETSMLLMYQRFVKHIKNYPMNEKCKRELFTEFKSTKLDKSYPNIKKDLLQYLNKLNPSIIYAKENIEDIVFNQEVKERCYIKLLTQVIKSIDTETIVYFDSFSKKDFEINIVDSISKLKNVISIEPKDSLNNKGIQLVDNVCGTIRRHIAGNDENNFYSIIDNCTKNI